MAATTETGTGVASDTAAARKRGERLQFDVSLKPVDHSDQPVFCNVSAVHGASGTVLVDFGFLEPRALPEAARLAQAGGKVPETINGRLCCRLALGLDTAVQLVQQLDQHLRSVQARVQQGSRPEGSGS
jgi:hypothetical protein